MATAATQQIDQRNQPLQQDVPRDAPEPAKAPTQREIAAKIADLVNNTGLSEEIAEVLANITQEDFENPSKAKLADIAQILSGALHAAKEKNKMYADAKKELEAAKGAARSSEDIHRQETTGFLRDMLDWTSAITGKKDDQKTAELKSVASKLIERAGAQDLGDMKLLFSTLRQASIAADNAVNVASMQQWSRQRDEDRIRNAYSGIKRMWTDPPDKRFVAREGNDDADGAKRRFTEPYSPPPGRGEQRDSPQKPVGGSDEVLSSLGAFLGKSAANSVNNEQSHSFHTRKD